MNVASSKIYLDEAISNNLETIQMRYPVILCCLILASCATKTDKIEKVENDIKKVM